MTLVTARPSLEALTRTKEKKGHPETALRNGTVQSHPRLGDGLPYYRRKRTSTDVYPVRQGLRRNSMEI